MSLIFKCSNGDKLRLDVWETWWGKLIWGVVEKVDEYIKFPSEDEHFKKYEKLKCSSNKC